MIDELEQRYRQARDPVERSHWQIIWLHAQGHPGTTIAQVTGYSTVWISRILHRYDQHGPDGVGDRRHQNPGQPPLVPPEVRAKLAQLLDSPAPNGGRWTGVQVARWLQQELGVEHVHPPRGCELLRQLGYRSDAARPHRQTAPPKQGTRRTPSRPDRGDVGGAG
jgi:transposase